MKLAALALALAVPLLAQPLSAQDAPAAEEGGPFVEGADAEAAIAAAIATARERLLSGEDGVQPQRILAIFGANWCHDSLDLVAMLERPRIAALIARHYQVVLVDAGVPQIGQGHNTQLSARLGVYGISGTPTVMVLDADGELQNSPDDARSWRNASSRSEDEVYRFLREWAKPARS